jgi:hypothetical protein
LRYEYNSPPVDADDRATVYDVTTRSLVPVGTNGVPRAGFDADKNNFAPRVGFAWSVNEETVLRGGYGIYYDQSPLAPAEALYFNSPFFDNNIFFSLPGLPLTLADPFPSFFRSRCLTPRSRFSAICARLHAALELQRRTTTRQPQRVRSRLRRLERYEAIDGARHQPAAAECVAAGTPFRAEARSAFRRYRPARVAREFDYHALQARFQQRLTRGFSALASYTWSKSIDDASNFFTSAGDPNFPQNSFNLAAERGLSNFDVRHRFSLSYSYALPFRHAGDGVVAHLVNGWERSGSSRFSLAGPFTVALLSEIDNSGTGTIDSRFRR